MNAITATLDRIATIPNVLRVRAGDFERVVLNGKKDEQVAREEAFLARLEKAVEKLEKATA